MNHQKISLSLKNDFLQECSKGSNDSEERNSKSFLFEGEPEEVPSGVEFFSHFGQEQVFMSLFLNNFEPQKRSTAVPANVSSLSLGPIR